MNEEHVARQLLRYLPLLVAGLVVVGCGEAPSGSEPAASEPMQSGMATASRSATSPPMKPGPRMATPAASEAATEQAAVGEAAHALRATEPTATESMPRASTSAPVPGVRLVWVDWTSVLALSCLEPGDVVTSWSSLADGGEIAGPFDWERLIIEEAPRGMIELLGYRGEEPRTWRVPMGGWRARIAPVGPQRIAGAVEKAERLWDDSPGDREASLDAWRRLLELETDGIAPSLRAWLHLQAGRRFDEAGRHEDALARMRQARQVVDPWRRSLVEIALGSALGRHGEKEAEMSVIDVAIETLQASPPSLLLGRAIFEKARVARRTAETLRVERLFRQALEIQTREAPESLEVARTLGFLASIPAPWGEAGSFEEAEEARRLQLELDPLGPDLFVTLINMGHVGLRLEDPESTAVFYEEAAEQARARGHDLDEARASFSLSHVEQMRGNLRQAEALLERSREIFDQLDPESILVAKALNNLGSLSIRRGDVAKAARRLRHALRIKERLLPGSSTVANTLASLGQLSLSLGDLESAKRYQESALELWERTSTGSNLVAEGRVELARLYIESGAFDEAAALLASARLEDPESPAAETSNARITAIEGEVARQKGQLDLAARFYAAALDVFRRLEPGSLDVATLCYELAGVAIAQGRWSEAEAQLEHAVEIVTRQAPGSARLARAHHALGTVSRARGEMEQALARYLEAIGALEEQVDRLEADVADRGTYRARFAELYEDPITLLLELGREAEAHELLERFRAASLLAILAERDIDFSADVPPEVLAEKRRVEARIDRLHHERSLVQARSAGPEAESGQDAELDDLRRERRRLLEKIRRSSSERYRDLRYPRPLEVAEIQQTLPAGTAMLSYFLGEEESQLFVIDAEQIHAFPLDLDVAQLAESVAAWRRAIDGHRNADSPSFEANVLRRGKRLFSSLVEPAWAVIEGAERLVILPDGALQFLPWGALVTREARYLAGAKPLHLALSATFYARLLDARQAGATATELVAFGDPVYPRPGTKPSAARQLAEALRDFDLRPLPGTRAEVETIARLFEDEARVFLGEQADEAAAKSEVRHADIVHFATHAWWDARFAMDSALVLTLPESYQAGQENGLLQAWEIFEYVRLDADLVVLSACSTARGELAGGEGVIGLTRAFQYAGARSVLSSQWNVSDEATTVLMESFYRHLHEGAAKDEALQEAQLELLREPETAAPFYWAAFQLDGDPR